MFLGQNPVCLSDSENCIAFDKSINFVYRRAVNLVIFFLTNYSNVFCASPIEFCATVFVI